MTTAPRIDAVFDLDALLSEDEREWQQRARRFAQERIMPVFEEDFEAQSSMYFTTHGPSQVSCSTASSWMTT